MDENFGASANSTDETAFKEQDKLLPIANVGRIMKQILPPNAKISKEAKETMQECVSEFISFVTSEASDKCRKERRKTVNGDDVCWAMGALGFDDCAGPLRRYLQRYRELEGERANQDKASNEEDREDGPSSSSYRNIISPGLLQPPPAPFTNKYDGSDMRNSNNSSSSRPF